MATEENNKLYFPLFSKIYFYKYLTFPMLDIFYSIEFGA